LIIITIPVGLYGGYLFTGFIMKFLGDFSSNSRTQEVIASSKSFALIAAVSCCIIMSIGVYIDSGVRKMPLSKIMYDIPEINKEV
jgi:hypothetical protein